MRILVTGAGGYVGSRLITALIVDGHHVRAALRDPARAMNFVWGNAVETVHFDLSVSESFDRATRDIDTVFYLVHSMAHGDFARKDREAAHTMARACARNGVKQIVYLSGLVPPKVDLSEHIRSRLEVEETFLGGSVPAIVLRAAVVIGAGSTSFELIRRLTERMPVTAFPRSARSMVQPVAIDDVIETLCCAVLVKPRNDHFDLGGDEVLSYSDLVERYARIAGLRSLSFSVPYLPTVVLGQAAAAVSGIPRGTVLALVESLRHDMICRDHHVRGEILSDRHAFLGLDEAISRSLAWAKTGTDPDGDVQSAAESDPEWSGGDVYMVDGLPVRRPGGVLARLLLGCR
ncbi:uncharacterized protein YbjT (DUF2867 family) [Rhodococcus sp. 27YEA15]|uniref:NAD(P)H-binding protein n=1 Tax=Rhodococcus sp. 27YEA15 TaxID=3156259 RepID=UPI003C7C158F